MRTYCLACRKHANNVVSWNEPMTYEAVRNKSKCGVCLSDKMKKVATITNKKSGHNKKSSK